LSYYGNGLWSGADNQSACGSSVNATISGFSVTIPKNNGSPVYGPGVIYGDSLYSTLYGVTDAQWTMYTRLKCNKIDKSGNILGPPSWMGVAAFSGFFGGLNYGFLYCGIPGKKGVVATLGPTVGAARRPRVKR